MMKLASTKRCTGCTSCANMCAHNAISMLKDEDGFFYPSIDNEKCVGCGKCTKACPLLSPVENENTTIPKAFAIWSFQDRIVSSSGGAFSAFARKILDKGGIVFGAAFDEKLRCRHIKVGTLEELSPLRGSKYVQSELGDIFLKVDRKSVV